MVQTQAVAQVSKLDMYLQSNMASKAYQWYQHRGFKPAASNELTELPERLQKLHHSSQLTDNKGPYVHYVTPEVWAAEIISDKGDPNSKFYQRQRLQLMHLDTRLNMDKNKIVMDITTVQSNDVHVVHSVIPGRADSYF